MSVFDSYFDNLVFTLVEKKEGFGVYVAQLNSGLAGGLNQYVILFVPEYLSIKERGRIHSLPWQNLQTREITWNYRLPKQKWRLDSGFPDVQLYVQQRTKEFTKYGVSEANDSFPYEIQLLHNPKKKTIYQYHNKMLLSAAVSTFQCVVSYIGDDMSSPEPVEDTRRSGDSYRLLV